MKSNLSNTVMKIQDIAENSMQGNWDYILSTDKCNHFLMGQSVIQKSKTTILGIETHVSVRQS